MNKGYSENELKDKRSFRRILELQVKPIKGDFNLEHLKKINGYIFQDSSDLAGKFRPEVKVYSDELWHKNRNYPKFGVITVCYSSMDRQSIEEAKNVLNSINIEHMKGLNQNDFAKELADIYKKLDYFHPFPDGNSRTLREFTRTLSEEVGFKLDWSKHNQQEIYLARDFEVNTITLSKVSDRNQKFFLEDEIEAILKHPQYKSLEKIINDSLIPLERQKTYQVDFSYNKELSERIGQKSYDVLVDGVKANELIMQDSQLSKALDGLANHKDMQQKGITAEALKSGVIQPKQLDNELKINRPEARTINANGSKIELKLQGQQFQKSKDFSL
ncbi:Fic family protein [Avibacterium avium]|uniref:Fic family protein n=1 Tax=Avibacterium avium TaxID=751 RepID=UPI003BF8AB66